MNRIFEKVKIKVTFTKPSNRVALSSGDELPTLMGKIKKYLDDLTTVAFSGKFSDLTKVSDDAGSNNSLGLTKLYSFSDCMDNSDTIEKATDGALTVGAAWSMITSMQDKIQNLGESSSSGGATIDSRLDELFAKQTVDEIETWSAKTDLIPNQIEKLSIGSTSFRWLKGFFKGIQVSEISSTDTFSENYTGHYLDLKLNYSDPDNHSGYCNGIMAFANGNEWGVAAGAGLRGEGYNQSVINQVVIGHYNSSFSGSEIGTNGTAFVIGNGTGITDDSNAFFVAYDGSAFSRRTLLTGADYAEYMEWKDKNPEDKDRVGRFVTLVKDKIAIANSGDYIVGIVSGNASVIGNDDFQEWSGRFLKDKFGRLILGDVETVDEESGEIKILHNQPQSNPDYDTSLTYIPRSTRPEWDTVGMLGVLRVIDDGTCVADGWCKVSDDGIATAATIEENSFLTPIFKVMKRTSDDVIEIFFK